MSSLIEQAAQRLDQLRRTGVAIPKPTSVESPTVGPGSARVEMTPAAVQGDPPPKAPTATSQQVTLDLDALNAAGFVTPDSPRTHIADQYRVIKRPLILNAKGTGPAALNHGNLIMVTSSLVGEGKSFTSINLAMSIAMEVDNTVMLVDADVARPSVLRMLGLPEGPGLLDLLEGEMEMSDVLLKTNIDKLTILPSGTPHPQATELLASNSMKLLLDDIAHRYSDRIIIFDSPPLLLTTEARVLATLMGQVVMVVQAEKTLQADVQHALSTIKACSHISLMLNKARASADGAGASYGYGYGYGYGGEKRMA